MEKLDQMIESIEKSMQQAAGGSAPGNSNDSNSPADESVVKGATAPGNVDKKVVKEDGGWGSLPPREREAAKSELNDHYPSHYSRLIDAFSIRGAKSRPAND